MVVAIINAQRSRLLDYRTKDDCFVQYNTKRYACLCTVDKHHAEQQSYTGESPALRHLVVG